MKRVQRFPRIEMTAAISLGEKILHHTYNELAKSTLMNSSRYVNPKYDLYETVRGKAARAKFLILSYRLNHYKIDPALFMKVMWNYGPTHRRGFMPHPTWLGSEKALGVFQWKLKSERRKYENHSDWKLAMRANQSGDILQAVRDSAASVTAIQKSFGLSAREAIGLLEHELSPWFLAVGSKKCPVEHSAKRCWGFLQGEDRLRQKGQKIYFSLFR